MFFCNINFFKGEGFDWNAYYLIDYIYEYARGLKKIFCLKNLLILVIGVALSMLITYLFGNVLNILSGISPVVISIFSITFISFITMLIFDRKTYLTILPNRIKDIFKLKKYYSAYIIISIFILIGILLCIFENSILTLGLGLMFIFAPNIVSEFMSATINSIFKSIKKSFRIGSNYLDTLLGGVGIFYIIISIIFIIIGGVL